VRSHPGGDVSERQVLQINETNFTHYHRFASTATILPAASEP
jgi:hypothetical protein